MMRRMRVFQARKVTDVIFMFNRGSQIFIAGGLLAVLFFSVPSFSTEKSKALVKKGHTFLVKKNFKKALNPIEKAIQADPNDAEAFFFKGVTLNRLEKGREAALALDQSKKMGFQHSEWLFERGWSHLLASEWKQAIDILKKFDKDYPGRGQTSEFISRAYMGLKDYKQAKVYLQEAFRRDPNLPFFDELRAKK